MDNKYKNGKIYTIRNINDDTLIYVGSTVLSLYKRLSAHKTSSKDLRKKNMLLYIKMNETNINDWFIELFEDYPCERKEILNKREGEVIREISTLNKRIEGRTKKEWEEENIEQRKEYLEGYYLKNKEKIKEYSKVSYKDNKDKINERHKEYHINNKDKMNEKSKEYREGNQDKIKENREANKKNAKENAKKYYLKKKLEKKKLI
jgi:hypothetical protein